MKKVLIICLALSLGGCASTLQTIKDDAAAVKAKIVQVVTPQNADTVEAAYGSALAIVVGYRDLCQRKVINKSCWIVIAKMQPYENKAYNAVKAMRKFVNDNPNVDASSIVQIAYNAVTTFKQVQNANGVN